MAFDGITIAALTAELKDKLVGGRVMKISQPERDEIVLVIKNYNQYKLLLSADASLPLVYITNQTKEAPLTSPAFCMLLRKHLQSAKIIDISQPEFERIIYIDFEHLDDMGDLKQKRLIIEIMGKHSNIIFCDSEGTIIDSIKRVPSSVSSVREVLPGREYFITKTLDKLNPLTVTEEEFKKEVLGQPQPIPKAIYTRLTGISPVMAQEITYRASMSAELDALGLDEDIKIHIYKTFKRTMEDVESASFMPEVYMESDNPKEYSALELTSIKSLEGISIKKYDSISALLEEYYESKNIATRIKQRSTDLSKIIANAISRESKKYELQLKQLKDTEKRDTYRVYGELLTTYGYGLSEGLKEATLNNYYTGEDIKIPLEAELSPIENAKKYFDKYSKLKRTYEALTKYIVETKEELDHLGSIKVALDMARFEEDLFAIREELAEFGYMKKHDKSSKKTQKGKNGRRVSRPFHYVVGDGFHVYVGKNNYQNDELTFKFANGADWWFHAKGCPGSHVVLKTEGREVPDAVFEQAASLAAFYSANKDNDKVEVDYLERRNVKKPNGAKPGFVVYYTNYSMVAVPAVTGDLQPEG